MALWLIWLAEGDSDQCVISKHTPGAERNLGWEMRGKAWQGGRSQGVFGFDVERSSVLWPAWCGREHAWKAGEWQANRKPLQ